MRLSLVLPVYNRYPVMADVLASLRYQSSPPDEVLLVDDGSTDGPLAELAASYSPWLPSLRYLRLERDGAYRNSSYPYNVGIRQATGDVIAYCAAELIHFPRNFELIRRDLTPDALLIGGTVFFEAEFSRWPAVVREDPVNIWRTDFDVWHREYYGNEHRTLLMWDTRSAVHAVYREHLLAVRGFEESLTAWGHNDGHMRRRLVELLGLREVRRPQIVTLHCWHPRPPRSNMCHSTEDRLAAAASGLEANIGREWGVYPCAG